MIRVREARDDAPFTALVFKIQTDPFVGQLAFFRSIATDDVIAHRQVASERRRLVREARANARFDAAVARHEARRVAEAVAKATAALKAKRSAAAKKAAETRKANRLAAEAANDQVAMS